MKKHAFLFGAVSLSLCLALSVGTAALETVETTIQNPPPQAVLTAETVTPGLNIFTGTVEAENFENTETWVINNASNDGLYYSSSTWNSTYGTKIYMRGGFTSGSQANIVPSTHSKLSGVTDTDGRSLVFAHWANPLPQDALAINVKVPEYPRTYYIGFDVYSDAPANGDTGSKLHILDGWTGTTEVTDIAGLKSDDKTWKKDIGASIKVTQDQGIYLAWTLNTKLDKTQRIYFDNLLCVPYYKITYQGTEVTTEEFLFDKTVTPWVLATSYPIKTDNYPTADGKICIGWSTEENATEAMTSVALENADITLYPVWKEASKAPTMLKRNQIKNEGAMRFISIIDLAVAYDENTEEYGFLAALESTLAGTELTLDSTVAKVQGVAYNKEKGINIYYTRSATSDIQEVVNGTNQAVTAVVTGIPVSGYSQNLVVRPYITISGVTYYGEAFANNYAAVAGNSQEG